MDWELLILRSVKFWFGKYHELYKVLNIKDKDKR